MNNNNQHNELVRLALEELAKAGYCAWKSGAGAYKTETGGFIKYGKKGGGDITLIVPRTVKLLKPIEGSLPLRYEIDNSRGATIIGQHVEAEAKTGTGRQNDNQKKHQEFVVERNGGIYILFHSVEELLYQVRGIK